MNPHPPLLTSLRSLPRPAWIIFIGTFLNKFGTFVIPFLTLYLTSRGYTVADAGIAVGAYGLGSMLASLLGGYLADQLGRRPTIILSMFLGAVTMMALSQARCLPLIIALTALTGLASEFYRPASNALLADVVPPEQRVTAFATLRMAFNAGFAFGPATAGLLAAFGYFWLFVGDAATSALYGVFAFLFLPKDAHARRNNASWGEAWCVLRYDHKLHQMLAANLCIGLIFFQMASTLGLYITQLGFSPAVYGLIISLNGALIVFCELPLTTITRRFPTRHVMAVGYLVVAVGFSLNLLAHSITALVACMLVFTLGEMITMPMASAYVANLAPANLRGRYLGVSALTWSFALIIGPGLGMQLLAYSPAVYFISFGALGLLAAVIITAPIKTKNTVPSPTTGLTTS